MSAAQRYARQLSAAQSAHDNMSPPEDSALAERIVHETRYDDAVIREIAESMAEELDFTQIADLLLAVIRLHHTKTEQMIGSDALVDVLRLGRQWDTEHEWRMEAKIDSRIKQECAA